MKTVSQPWFGSSGGSTTPEPIPVPLGTLFDFNFATAANLNDFTQTKPNSTMTLSGGYLHVENNPGSGGFGNYIIFNGYESSIVEKNTLETIVIPRNTTADSYGVSIGFIRTQILAGAGDLWGFMEMDSSSDKGRLYIYQGVGIVATSGVVHLTYSNNHRLKISLNRNINTYVFTAENLTVPDILSISYTTSNAYSGPGNQTIGKPILYFSGGTQDVESWTGSSLAMKNAKVTFIGDSITNGYGVPAISDRYATKIMNGSLNEYNVCGSSGSQSSDWLLCRNELAALNSEYYVICAGVNDQLQGVAVNTTKSNLQTLIAALPGIKILNYIIPVGTNDPAPYNAMIDTIATLPIPNITNVLGTGTPKLPNPIYYNADVIHPIVPGHTEMTNEYLLKYPQLST